MVPMNSEQPISPMRPVSAATQQMLVAQLSNLTQWLRSAAADTPHDLDPEYVQHLRQAVRRSLETLRLFRHLVAPRRARKIRQQLREVLRASAKVHGYDRLATRLTRDSDAQSHVACGLLVDRLQDHRSAAAAALRAGCRELSSEAFAQQITRLGRGIRFRPQRQGQPEPPFGKTARRLLKRPVRKFLRAWRADLADEAALRKVWRRGRRLKIAMKLLATAFDFSFRDELYPRLCKLQDRLAEIHEQVVVRTQLKDWRDRTRSKQERDLWNQLLADEETAFADSLKRSGRWWTPQHTGKLRRDLMRYAMTATDDACP